MEDFGLHGKITVLVVLRKLIANTDIEKFQKIISTLKEN